MARYRKKPVEIEAVQYLPDESNHNEIVRNTYGLWGGSGGRGELIGMVTVHGERAYASPGDWIVQEPEFGKHYPVKPDIFDQIYEEVT